MTDQLTLPGLGTSEVESLAREIADAGRLNSINVTHREATANGWREGWFASVVFDYKPVDRDGNHPCVVLGHDMNDPIAALLEALHKAKEHMT